MEKILIGKVKGEDGKSAYEIALDEGFEGTEEEWLESLKAKASTTAMTFTTAIPLAWVEDTENGGYTQTVAVDGILETDNPIADIVLGADVDANALYLEAWACITRITTADDSITLYANEDAPETAFSVQMKVVR